MDHVDLITRPLLVITSQPSNFERFRPLFQSVSVLSLMDDGCSFESVVSIESALAAHQPEAVVIVNRPPLSMACVVQTLRSLEAGKNAYIILATPSEAKQSIDVSLDADDFVLLGSDEESILAALRVGSARFNRFIENKLRFTEAAKTAQSALESVADYGSLLHFLELSEQCTDLSSLADTVVSYLNGKGLNVFFCIKSDEQDFYRPIGNASTTKKQLLEAVKKSQQRIIAVDRMLGFNFEHFVLLVIAAQYDDAGKYGQMKDNLAQFCAIVESRVKSILVRNKINRQHEHLLDVLGLVRQISVDARESTHNIMNNFSREIAVVSTTFDMSELEESKLLELARTVREDLEELSHTNESIEEHFHDLIKLISSVKELLDSTPEHRVALDEGMNVELF
ncbi:MAG TPA: hypothetical protein VFM46_03805 [Pseudomonadales bacterium]|nr:hypothetical protein [Pseudomonadales bacterium]